MSITTLKNAFENQYALAFLDIQHSWENVNFIPTNGVAYDEISWLFAKPDNPTIDPTNGLKFHRENGYVQITLCFPVGFGRADIDAQTDAIRAAFPRGTSIAFDTGTLIVLGTPQVLPGQADGDRWRVIVKILFFANIFE